MPVKMKSTCFWECKRHVNLVVVFKAVSCIKRRRSVRCHFWFRTWGIFIKKWNSKNLPKSNSWKSRMTFQHSPYRKWRNQKSSIYKRQNFPFDLHWKCIFAKTIRVRTRIHPNHRAKPNVGHFNRTRSFPWSWLWRKSLVYGRWHIWVMRKRGYWED